MEIQLLHITAGIIIPTCTIERNGIYSNMAQNVESTKSLAKKRTGYDIPFDEQKLSKTGSKPHKNVEKEILIRISMSAIPEHL